MEPGDYGGGIAGCAYTFGRWAGGRTLDRSDGANVAGGFHVLPAQYRRECRCPGVLRAGHTCQRTRACADRLPSGAPLAWAATGRPARHSLGVRVDAEPSRTACV